MANDDVFARLAALTSGPSSLNRENSPDGENEPTLDLSSFKRPRTRTLSHGYGFGTPSLGGSGISTTMTSSVPPSSPGSPGKRPRKRARLDVGDRFVPSKDIDERQRAFNLMGDDDFPFGSTHRIIPHESDAAKEQANATFSTMLSKELVDDDVMSHSSQSSSPIRPPSATSGPSSSLPGSSAHSTVGDALPTTPTRKRVFSFRTPPRTGASTPVPMGQDTPLASSYATSPIKTTTSNFITSPQKPLRNVCKTPFRVLDAPELMDDFYLNLVDWSSTNVLGVGLGSCVYLWSAKTAQVTKLCDLGQADSITSLCWVQKGSTLAVGTLKGYVEIWDAVKNVRLRHYEGHEHRVGSLAWNEATITSGSRDRTIQLRDVRAPGKAYSSLVGHRQEVCGLKWHSGLRQLASGGNDNKLLIWDHRNSAPETPLWKFHDHQAAVKAIAWNPHQSGILVSGGGTQDKKMRFWNTASGTLLNEIDTGSQTSQELVSTHGYSSTYGQNLICIWKYPSMDMVATLSGHTHRVLYLAMSPDGQTIVTGAGDETLRFWNAFPKRKEAGIGETEGRREHWNWAGMIR
ncbi:substrate-specific activator of APC-dependent proteolysis [Serendipita sp. 399]|nr:substrate-specific activator of APC-dependent proteolysis [Serendipita sp. 399]